MTPLWLYYACVLVLLLANVAAWLSNLVALPGNWGVVLFSALFAWLLPSEGSGPDVRWSIVALLVVLAVAGEVIEFLAGAAGAAKQGASRRSIALSILGAILGSAAGLVLGLPVPIVGSAMAAILGGALGAFAGAYLGEEWKGRHPEQRMQIARGAFSGRLWGTAGKLAVGALMLVLVTFDSLM